MKTSQKIFVNDAFVKWILNNFVNYVPTFTLSTFIYSIRILANELVLAYSRGSY